MRAVDQQACSIQSRTICLQGAVNSMPIISPSPRTSLMKLILLSEFLQPHPEICARFTNRRHQFIQDARRTRGYAASDYVAAECRTVHTGAGSTCAARSLQMIAPSGNPQEIGLAITAMSGMMTGSKADIRSTYPAARPRIGSHRTPAARRSGRRSSRARRTNSVVTAGRSHLPPGLPRVRFRGPFRYRLLQRGDIVGMNEPSRREGVARNPFDICADR